jgi:hypothetical protein
VSEVAAEMKLGNGAAKTEQVRLVIRNQDGSAVAQVQDATRAVGGYDCFR